MDVEHLRLLYVFQNDLGAFALTIRVPNGFRLKKLEKKMVLVLLGNAIQISTGNYCGFCTSEQNNVMFYTNSEVTASKILILAYTCSKNARRRGRP